jgi:dihydropteroate synthase
MTKIVGILNLTPDSFSDGGLYSTKEQIINKTIEICKNGAGIIDIGAESTRPSENKQPISAEEEWHRLEFGLAEIIAIAKDYQVDISIDTRNYSTAKKAISYDVNWINDVSGGNNENLVNLISSNKIKIVIMHNLGVPPSKNNILNSNNPEKIIYSWLENKINSLNQKNILNNQIIIDPGIGFGNDSTQAFKILKNIDIFKQLNCQILVGHSRKSMFDICTDLPAKKRDIETLAISTILAYKKIDFIRVHNIIYHARMIKTLLALQGD